MSAGLAVTFVDHHISVSSSITYWSVNTDSHHLTNTVASIRLLIARVGLLHVISSSDSADKRLCACFPPQVMHLQRAELNGEALCPMHASSIHGVEDMSTLAELHEAAIMHNLFLRYQKDNIYVSRIPEEIVMCWPQK